jgi:hypothetical protein
VSIAATCEQCHTRFDPVTGGICAQCHRLLCGRHLRGWRPALFALFERAQPVCVACRRADEAPSSGATRPDDARS